jgi:anti-sigma B factor antagonist
MSCFRVRRVDDWLIVRFTCAEISASDAATIKAGLLRIAQRRRSRRVILDFGHVESMSSAMIGTLVLFNKHAAINRIKFRLYRVRKNVMQVFKITRLNKVFTFGGRDRHRSVRFAPELFEARNRVLLALANADLYWLSDFTSVEPLHDVYGIEVRGIKDLGTADRIQKLLLDLFPAWRAPP